MNVLYMYIHVFLITPLVFYLIVLFSIESFQNTMLSVLNRSYLGYKYFGIYSNWEYHHNENCITNYLHV